jgi:hypothetical protein
MIVANRASMAEELNSAELVGAILRDGETLLRQQADLLRSEVKQELARAGRAGAQIAAGGGLVAAAGLLSGFMLAHLLRRLTGLPLWTCYGGTGAILGAGGAALLRAGRDQLADIHLLPPPQTAQALKDNLQWLKDQVDPKRTT